MRRRIAALVFVAAVLALALGGLHRPVDVDLALSFGPSARDVRLVRLWFEDGHQTVVRDLTLAFPEGAPSEASRRVRLRAGTYALAAQISYAHRPDWHPVRQLVVEGGRAAIDLSPDRHP
jgi:hypothetical protein